MVETKYQMKLDRAFKIQVQHLKCTLESSTYLSIKMKAEVKIESGAHVNGMQMRSEY